ncbi:MAG: recombination regulator RecX [Gammaproteobacteria bacterium]|nr:recombination regulator RecX [Gammaproteobacteria bacterium]
MNEEQKAIRHAAIALLSRREHGCQELYHKLCLKGHAPALCDAVLRELQAEGLLSDQRYAEAYVRMRANRGYGPERIRMELKEKGISSTLIQAELQQAESDWFALAREVRIKRFGELLPKDFRERAKQMRFLQYRGFSNDQIGFATDDGE